MPQTIPSCYYTKNFFLAWVTLWTGNSEKAATPTFDAKNPHPYLATPHRSGEEARTSALVHSRISRQRTPVPAPRLPSPCIIFTPDRNNLSTLSDTYTVHVEGLTPRSIPEPAAPLIIRWNSSVRRWIHRQSPRPTSPFLPDGTTLLRPYGASSRYLLTYSTNDSSARACLAADMNGSFSLDASDAFAIQHAVHYGWR